MSAAIKILPAFLLAFILISCQKEIKFNGDLGPANGGTNNGGNGGSGGNTSNIEGNYDFVGTYGTTLATLTLSSGGIELKTVTTSAYNTVNNTGTARITSNQFISTNVGYDIDTTMHVKTYILGALSDEEDLPFDASTPPTSTTANYVRNSADSITFDPGTWGTVTDPSGAGIPVGPLGGKLSWHGDTLWVKSSFILTRDVDQGGTPAHIVSSATAISKWKKH